MRRHEVVYRTGLVALALLGAFLYILMEQIEHDECYAHRACFTTEEVADVTGQVE